MKFKGKTQQKPNKAIPLVLSSLDYLFKKSQNFQYFLTGPWTDHKINRKYRALQSIEHTYLYIEALTFCKAAPERKLCGEKKTPEENLLALIAYSARPFPFFPFHSISNCSALVLHFKNTIKCPRGQQYPF